MRFFGSRSVLVSIAANLVMACSGPEARPAPPPPVPEVMLPKTPEPQPEPPPPPANPVCTEANVASLLQNTAGVSNLKEEACGKYVTGSARCFLFSFQQATDHKNPAATFAQRVRLIHRGCGEGMTIEDSGYEDAGIYYESEPSLLFGTNTVSLEHRFQGRSRPKGDDIWPSLTIENGAGDLHELIRALRPTYPQRWVSTGASKGGITAVYHRFFYPKDVDGTIGYVAPASRARADSRYQERLMSMAFPEACASKVRAFQVNTLSVRREALVSMLISQYGVTADEAAFALESYAASFDWAFWQYEFDCQLVPSEQEPDSAYFEVFRKQIDAGQQSGGDPMEQQLSSAALSYEWSWQQGFALQTGAHVLPLLKTEAGTRRGIEETWLSAFPDKPLPAYDGSLTESVRAWVSTKAEHMILVYGEQDPWSGGALDAPQQASSVRYFAPNRGHGAEILSLVASDAAEALQKASSFFNKPAVQFFRGTKIHADVLVAHNQRLRHEAQSLRQLVQRDLRPMLTR
jgi:hypothetical protein